MVMGPYMYVSIYVLVETLRVKTTYFDILDANDRVFGAPEGGIGGPMLPPLPEDILNFHVNTRYFKET